MERYTEYHCGVAVIKNKELLKEAMAKLAAYEDAEEEGMLFIFPGTNEAQICRKSVGNALDAMLKCVGPRITYQKAIDWMDAFKRTYKGSPKEKEARQACDMAIEALRERSEKE